MKKLIGLGFFTVIMLTSWCFGVASAAYIDPAATSYIIQIVAGVVIAAGAAVGIFWKRIRMFFKRKKMENLERKLTKEADRREESEKQIK